MKADLHIQRTHWWLLERKPMVEGWIGEGDSEVQTSSYKLSYGDEIYSIRNIVNNIVITLWRQVVTYLSVHFIMYANIKSICSTPETNIYVRYILVFKGNMFNVEDKKCFFIE